MKILIGYGKTTYFLFQHPISRVLQASDLSELRSSILSVQSPFLDPLPTLINSWFIFDFKDIADLKNINCYLEIHYPPVKKSVITEMQKTLIKHFSGDIIICDIDEKLLQRKDQPILYHLMEHQTEEKWNDMDYILKLGDISGNRWISYKWGRNKTIDLVDLLKNYLTK